jgi:hypothetical protein
MIPVGTPGLGVRQPDGYTLTFFHPGDFPPGWVHVNSFPSRRRLFHPDDFPIRTIFPSGRFSIRVADAQTGRPYSNHFPKGIIFPKESFSQRNHHSKGTIIPRNHSPRGIIIPEIALFFILQHFH